jgi:hypothetical protein
MVTRNSNRSLLTRFATAFCAVMMVLGLVASPSFAGGIFSNNRQPEARTPETPTSDIMKDTGDIANPDKKPMSLDEIQARTNGGLNEIQGTADADKMINESQPGKPDSVFVDKMNKEMKKRAN